MVVRWTIRCLVVISFALPLAATAQPAKEEPCDEDATQDALGSLLDSFDPIKPSGLLYPDMPLKVERLFGGGNLGWQTDGIRYVLQKKGSHSAFLQPNADNVTSEETAVALAQELARRAPSNPELAEFANKLPTETATLRDGWFIRRYDRAGDGLIAYKQGRIGKPIIEQSIASNGDLGPRREITYSAAGLVTRVITDFDGRHSVQTYQYYPSGKIRRAYHVDPQGKSSELRFREDGSVIDN